MLDGNRIEKLSAIGLLIAISGGLYASSLYSYLLFHSLIEIVTIAVAFTLFIITWNSRAYLANGYLRLLGTGYAFIALIDLAHTLAYKGMTVFPGYDANLPTQLWIAARYLQAATLLVAPLFVHRKADDRAIFAGYALTVALLLGLVYSGNFPDCFVEGKGLTPFKIASEYLITALLLGALYLFYRQRASFKDRVFALIAVSIAFTALSEISFTAYASVYGLANLVGHFAKLAAFYLIYRAILVTGFKEPFDLIFRDLKQVEADLWKAQHSLEDKVRERTAELRDSEEKYRSLIEKVHTAIVLHDGAGAILACNPMAEELLGLSAAQLRGKPLVDPEWSFVREDGSVSPVRDYPVGKVLATQQALRGYVMGIRRPDRGTVVWVLMDAEPEFDAAGKINQVIVSFVDISQRKHATEALHRINRELRAISNCNQTLMHAEDEPSLLDAICRIVCHEAGYRMAWVGFAEHDEAKTLRPVAWAGAESGYLTQTQFTWADTDEGRAPSGKAVRSGESAGIEDLASDPHPALWRTAALDRGYRSCIALPLKDDAGSSFGVLNIYAAQTNAFTAEEQRLLNELAGDLAFGIVALRTRAERKLAEEAEHRLNRELHAISKCNQTLMHATDEQALLDDICRIVCGEAGYRMAWVGFAEHDEAKTLRPVAWAGAETGYIELAHLTWADTEHGRRPSGIAVRSGEPAGIADYASTPMTAPWQAAAIEHGYRSSISLPLKDESANAFGVLNIYSAQPNAFTAAETRLLEELAGDMAFGIMVLRARIARNQALELIEKRIFALTRPMEDGSVSFDDLFNREEIQRIQDEFALATGVASLITTPDGTPLTAPSNFTELCSEIIRQTERGALNCSRSDAALGSYHPEGPIVQPCLSGGLWDAGASITVGGHHIANWLIGQVRDETQTEEKMRAYAREIGADEAAYMAAFRKVPAMSRTRFEQVARALFTLANQLSTSAYQNIQQARFITERRVAEQEIEHLAFYDLLTQLPNRRLLMDRLQQAMADSGRSRHRGALLFIDLDNFKVINNTCGHDAGDQLLIDVAERLTTCVRDGDTVSRLGGDEFVVMLKDLGENPQEAAAQAKVVGEKILAALNQPFSIGGHVHHSTPSIGVTLFLNSDSPMDELLKQADIAMYQAKAAGRNTLRFFDPEMQAALAARADLETSLRTAIQERQFVLHFQPQVDTVRGVIGAEALVRWQHPGGEIVSPAQFIPLAEETGLVLAIGQWVLEDACTQLKRWADDPLTRDLHLAVNVSARQFRQADFVAQVSQVLASTGAPANRLKLELTESLVLDNVKDTIEKMQALKQLGVGFSMDDFGTGYSSLSYLTRLPLDQLKIDQSFVRNLPDNANDAVVAQTVITLARSLDLGVIAEGVETEAQRQFLSEHGCPVFQGYLFSQPVPLDAFRELLAGG